MPSIAGLAFRLLDSVNAGRRVTLMRGGVGDSAPAAHGAPVSVRGGLGLEGPLALRAENLPSKHEGRFGILRNADLKIGRAWAFKESTRHLWEYVQRGWAPRHWNEWYSWATHSRLAPIIDAARTLKRHEDGLLSYFVHPITNAGVEGLNLHFQAIRVSARGCRNREHFNTAVYCHLGGLALYPQTH